MQLADEHIKEFQVLYKKHYGVEISTAEALEKGIRLIRLMEIVLKHEAKKRATQMVPTPITN
jgi:hypothetical protein